MPSVGLGTSTHPLGTDIMRRVSHFARPLARRFSSTGGAVGGKSPVEALLEQVGRCPRYLLTTCLSQLASATAAAAAAAAAPATTATTPATAAPATTATTAAYSTAATTATTTTAATTATTSITTTTTTTTSSFVPNHPATP